ncbi:MAG TPA: hypothetical protein VKX45_20580 [Bryobacteraceae bacterium]|jgi:TctA family transporter|nr:hypothetical protein [Bryobacteraceae bacterium]
MSLQALFLASLAVAAIGAAGPTLFRYDPWLTRSLFAGLWLAAIWAVLVAMALVQHGRRGLWLLVGAPMALWTPFVMGAIYWACAYRQNCL